MLLGTEMVFRGCDIVWLKISDINFKNRELRFIQNKTGVEIKLAMPVSVGSAVFKYLKSGRPKECSSDLLFESCWMGGVPYRITSQKISPTPTQ